MSSRSQVPVIPASALYGFTSANAPQLMPNPPPMPPQLHQMPPPMPQPPMHGYGHQRTDSGSSAGGRRTKNSSFSRRRADPRSRSSVPPQLGQPLPQIQPQSEGGLIGGARTAPVAGKLPIIKREMEDPNYTEAYDQRIKEEEAATGPSRPEHEARSQGMRSPDTMSQRSATGSIKSMKRELEETEQSLTLPWPPRLSECTVCFDTKLETGFHEYTVAGIVAQE